MRVLWFTNTPSNYLQGTNAYNGGGWISSLETEMCKKEGVELAVAFLLNGHYEREKRNGVSYYPIRNPYGGSIQGKIKSAATSYKRQMKYFKDEYLRIINDFHPDIINIFGTEENFGLIAKHTDVPIVIHIQGLLIPYLTAYFPPGYNLRDYIWTNYNIKSAFGRREGYRLFRQNANRERMIFQCNKHFIGRTEWDKQLTKIYNPQATYDYCSEILRDVFYQPCKRMIPERLIITTTISNPLYKGFDVVLKCAKIIKNQMKMDFEWRVYGNISPTLVERKEKVCAKDVNVRLMGVASQNELCKAIAMSTVYVHPSYIDNSPNSVCEAQMIGCTVVGQQVGGMPTLVTHGETGILVPANDPYQMAYAIRNLYLNPDFNEIMGQRATKIAHERHNREKIVNDLMAIYYKYIR